ARHREPSTGPRIRHAGLDPRGVGDPLPHAGQSSRHAGSAGGPAREVGAQGTSVRKAVRLLPARRGDHHGVLPYGHLQGGGMMRLAVMASHGGSILQAVMDACAAGEIDAKVVLVISNNSNSGAIARARAAGIPTAHLSSATHPDPAALDDAIVAALREARADWVLLAGYMKK